LLLIQPSRARSAVQQNGMRSCVKTLARQPAGTGCGSQKAQNIQATGGRFGARAAQG
jgi:hypothetical protein